MILDVLVGKFEDIAVNSGMLTAIDFFELAQRFFSSDDVKEMVLDLNRDRLYNKNTTRDGIKLPLYAEKTAKHKRRVGLPDVRYTYYETGDTHESLDLVVGDDYAVIVLGTDAPDYAQFLDGTAWGLTDEDYDEGVRGELLNFVQTEIKNFLFNG